MNKLVELVFLTNCQRVKCLQNLFAGKEKLKNNKYTLSAFPCSLKDVALAKLGDSGIHVKMVAAPINPADINMIQGNLDITCIV